MNISTREKNIWIELAITCAVSLYYLYSSFVLSGWSEIASYEMGIVVRNVFVISVVASIVLYSLKTQRKKMRETLPSKPSSGLHCLTVFCAIAVAAILTSEGIVLFGKTSLINGPVAIPDSGCTDVIRTDKAGLPTVLLPQRLARWQKRVLLKTISNSCALKITR